jgi:hypothetical protein
MPGRGKGCTPGCPHTKKNFSTAGGVTAIPPWLHGGLHLFIEPSLHLPKNK